MAFEQFKTNNKQDILTAVGSATKSTDKPTWGGTKIQPDSFFDKYKVDPERWNQMFPYRLVVVDASRGRGNKYPIVQMSGGDFNFSSTSRKVSGSQGIEYHINQEITLNAWEAPLPITPQQLKFSDVFAINTTATMRGIVEEHNGIKFKNIVATGTFGVYPNRPTLDGELSTPTSLQSLFADTAESFGGLASAFAGGSKAINLLPPTKVGSQGFSTGYYYAEHCAQFLERYAMAKKDPKNKDWRLVFDVPKRNQSFVVTPVSFTYQQDQQRPMEVMFAIQLRAWKRIEVDSGSAAKLDLDFNITPNTFQQIANTIQETRSVLSKSINVVKSVRSDFQRYFNILRQTSLAVKDAGGLVLSVADLPNQIISNADSTIADVSANISPIGAKTSANFLKQTNSAEGIAQIANSTSDLIKSNEGLSVSQVRSGSLGQEAAQSLETSNINSIYNAPEENFEFFDSIDLDDLTLTPEQEDAIEDEITRVQLFTVQDFRDFKKEILDLANDLASLYGAGDDTYSDVYGIEAPRDRVVPMTLEENEVLLALFDVIQSYDDLTFSKFYDDLNIESPLEFVGGLADETDIDFEDFSSKFLVPVPYGLSIEEIAIRYMGDPDKWIEIATLNKLSSPYIDEDGFEIALQSNGSGRQFTVVDTEDRLFVSQKILLSSDTVPIFARKIIDIEKIGDSGVTLVTVGGLSDLDSLTTTNNAKIKGFLPGTVNSQNQIFIPTNQAADEDDRGFSIAGLADPELTKISKVDFLLTDAGDVAIDSQGDFKLANGLTNMVQALKLKIITKKGTLLRHLDYGLGIRPGISNADINNGEILKALNQMVESDPRFNGVDRISIKLSGPTLSLDVGVKLANGSGILPISVDVPIG